MEPHSGWKPSMSHNSHTSDSLSQCQQFSSGHDLAICGHLCDFSSLSWYLTLSRYALM